MLNLAGSFNDGVVIRQESKLTVENCEFYGLNNGIDIDATDSVSVSVTVKNSVLRDNFNAILAQTVVNATVDGATISNNSYGIIVNGGHATVSNSVLSNNTYAALSATGSPAGTVLVLAHSTITGVSPTATGIEVYSLNGYTSVAVAEGNVMHINTAFKFDNAGGTETIYSSGDNKVVYYAAAVSGGTLTVLGSY